MAQSEVEASDDGEFPVTGRSRPAVDDSRGAPAAAQHGSAPRLVVLEEEAPAAETAAQGAPPVPAGAVSTARAPQPAEPAADAKRKRGAFRRFVLPVIVAALLAGGGWYGYHWWTIGRFIESTEDAYVQAHMAIVSPRIPGYVSAVTVEDNAAVKAGDPLVMLDDADERLAVQTAENRIATQQATIARIDKQILAARAQLAQATAQLRSARAVAARAEADYKRYTSLTRGDVVSQRQIDQARAEREQANAGVSAAEAGVAGAEANVAVLEAQRQEAERTLAGYRTQLEKAKLDLAHTVVRAPFDGIVGNRAVQVGEYVQPGQRLLALVPLHHVYVDANFKETQLARIEPGQKATISVDAFPDHDITGEVMSVAPASGAQFSLLPPENATGNFTKIVQRVPVRIRVPDEVAGRNLLRPGLSVVVEVDTRPDAAGEARVSLANR